MAAKKYAYYIKGNKLALIQVDNTLSTSDDEYGQYKSPTEAVTDGIKLEYAYVADTISDEDSDVSLTRHQANAVVYYVKAKLAEDAGEMELREYFLREFKRVLESGSAALKGGIYIAQGLKELR